MMHVVVCKSSMFPAVGNLIRKGYSVLFLILFPVVFDLYTVACNLSDLQVGLIYKSTVCCVFPFALCVCGLQLLVTRVPSCGFWFEVKVRSQNMLLSQFP